MRTTATRGRIDPYGNYIKQEMNESFPGIKGAKKDEKFEKLPTEVVEQDMIKFYGKFSSALSPEDTPANYITSSQHYKYTRLRDGGWG
jgi:hypothetical protein